LSSVWFFAEPLAWLAVFSWISWFNGRLILNACCSGFFGPTRIDSESQVGSWPGSALEQLFLNSVTGLAWLIMAATLLAVCGQLNPAAIASSMLIIPLLAALRFRGWLTTPATLEPKTLPLGWWMLVVVFVTTAARVFKPEAGFDALSYHLPYARLFAEAQALVVDESLRYPLNALGFDVLYSVGLLFDGEILARLFHVLASFGILTGVYALTQRFFGPLAAFLAGLFWIMTPLIRMLMVSGYIDIGLSLFIFAAVYGLLLYQSLELKRLLMFSAAMLGVALGIKYLALVTALILVVWVALLSRRLRTVLVYAAVAGLVGCFWYLRSWMIAGNPVHPFAQELFGFWLWTADDLAAQSADLLSVHGVDRTLINFIRMPFDLLHYDDYKHGRLGLPVLAGMLLAWLAIWQRPVLRATGLFVLANLVFWFFTSQLTRYLIPTLPLLLMLTSAYLAMALTWLVKPLRWIWPAIGSRNRRLMSFALITILIISSVSDLREEAGEGKLLVNEAQWQADLARHPEQQLADAARSPRALATMKLGFPKIQYRFSSPLMGDWFGPARMAGFVRKSTSTEALIEAMSALQVNQLLIDASYPYFVALRPLLDDPRFVEVFSNEAGWLYRYIGS